LELEAQFILPPFLIIGLEIVRKVPFASEGQGDVSLLLTGGHGYVGTVPFHNVQFSRNGISIVIVDGELNNDLTIKAGV
jgi:hypothetical protein